MRYLLASERFWTLVADIRLFFGVYRSGQWIWRRGFGEATHATDRGAGDAPAEQTSESIAGIGKSGET
jgi:hypothetical protein